jgi:signal transduction histidine kinase
MENKMNQEPENYFGDLSPEQKLHSMIAELRTPVEIIRGCAETIRITNLSQKIEPEGILINAISEAADKIRNLLDETIRSKGFYSPSKDISSTDILLALRQHLLNARQQNDMDALHSLEMVFGILEEVAGKKNTQGIIFGVLDDLATSAREAIHGIPWKSTIPSEEEIISALNTK